MGVYVQSKIWRGQVPYECKDEWALKGIELFNQTVKKCIWIPRTNQADYVDFQKKEHHQSPIGKQGGAQRVDYEHKMWTLHHEMCHALSLGHENFHPSWPLREKLLKSTSIHAFGYKDNSAKYIGYGGFDRLSVMLYPNERFGLDAKDALFAYGAANLNKVMSAGDITLVRLCHPDAPELLPVLRMRGG